MTHLEAELRAEARLACRVAATEGLGDLIWGHPSVRGLEPGTFWLNRARSFEAVWACLVRRPD